MCVCWPPISTGPANYDLKIYNWHSFRKWLMIVSFSLSPDDWLVCFSSQLYRPNRTCNEWLFLSKIDFIASICILFVFLFSQNNTLQMSNMPRACSSRIVEFNSSTFDRKLITTPSGPLGLCNWLRVWPPPPPSQIEPFHWHLSPGLFA